MSSRVKKARMTRAEVEQLNRDWLRAGLLADAAIARAGKASARLASMAAHPAGKGQADR